jgi:membrane protease YdiL (CAAX protease family)
LTVFLVLVFGIGWPILAVPVLAYHGVVPGGKLPIEFFALGVTLLVMLPAALWVTSVTEGRAGVRALMSRAFRWRFGPQWWAVVLLGLPVIALLLGLLSGGSLHTTNAMSVLASQALQILIAVLVINLWEETVWAGFLQTRLERRHNFVVAAALTAVPFAGVHMPLLLIGDHITVVSVLAGIGGLLLLGLVVRLMIGVILHGAADSLLAVGILHQMFDASNNRGGLVDSFIDGAAESVATLTAAVLITLGCAAAIHKQLGSKPLRSNNDATSQH